MNKKLLFILTLGLLTLSETASAWVGRPYWRGRPYWGRSYWGGWGPRWRGGWGGPYWRNPYRGNPYWNRDAAIASGVANVVDTAVTADAINRSYPTYWRE